jgi:hypothetical protein
MRLARTAACVLGAFGLTVVVNGQAGVPQAPLRTSEKQNLTGRIQIESVADKQTRIQFWVNTRTYLAKQVVLEADSFAIGREANGGVLIESAVPVRVTGFTLGQDINNVAMLQDAQGNVLMWEQGFKLRILADGALEWGCCPRRESSAATFGGMTGPVNEAAGGVTTVFVASSTATQQTSRSTADLAASLADLRSALQKQSSVRLVDTAEAADVILSVQDRQWKTTEAGSEPWGSDNQGSRPNFSTWARLTIQLRADGFSTSMVAQAKSWKGAASQAARDLTKWIDVNRRFLERSK